MPAVPDQDINALREALFNALTGRKPLGTIVTTVSLRPSVLECKDNNGRTPLCHACISSPPLPYEVIEYLLLTRPEAVGMRDNSNCTPLDRLCHYKPPLESIQLLMKYLPQTTPLQGNANRTPLHIACQNKASSEVIQHLADQLPVANLILDDANKLPLDYAEEAGLASITIQSLTRTMSEATCALAEVSAEAPLRVNMDLPWRVVAHAAATFSDFLSVERGNGKYGTKFAPSDLDKPTVRAMVVNCRETCAFNLLYVEKRSDPSCHQKKNVTINTKSSSTLLWSLERHHKAGQ